MAPKKLHLDIETYSSIDIKTSGVHRYARSLDFEILLIAWALDDGPIQINDIASGEGMDQVFLHHLKDPNIEKHAHNATFERTCFKQYGIDVPIEQWRCSMVKAAYCGYPLSLEMISKIMGLEEKGKLATGKALIRFFCSPVKPVKSNDFRCRNLPWHDIFKWEEFKSYCVNDVIAEREISTILDKYEIPAFEARNYMIDQEINDFGVKVDTDMAEKAIIMDGIVSERVSGMVKSITNVDNPNSPSQLKEWLGEAMGKEISTLAKDSVLELLDETDDEAVSDVLNFRLQLSKTSTKKYMAMLNCACEDKRARGLFQFYGAARTGRWAGRLIQLQNLPQNHMANLDMARDIVKTGDLELLEMLYGNIPEVLSELIRTAVVPPEGHVFIVSDFSAIEARVLSWLANEKWRLDVFRTHGKIYEASAAMMFGVPIDSVTKGSELRQRGKTAELALGYQGAVGALDKMDRDKKIPDSEKPGIVRRWQKANPSIINFWADIEDAAKRAIKVKRHVQRGNLGFDCDGENLILTLPSGRQLFYNSARIGKNRFGNESIIFKGLDQTVKQWSNIETYGGKLTENVVQATSRDILTDSMTRLRDEGFRIVMHVHDEIICEVKEEDAEEQLLRMERIMGEEVSWAPGLPLKAEGYITRFYKKD